MDVSSFIAKLVGPVMMAAGVALLFNRGLVQDIMQDVVKSPALLYIAGVSALVVGLVIVNTHNFWSPEWPVIITIIGWIAILGGIMRMIFPKTAIVMGDALARNRAVLVVIAAANLILGGYLSYQGYWA